MRVSILIPCYNKEQWIGEAIESALSQDYQDKEIIVIDDGSTDRSRTVIASFGNKIRSDFTDNRGGNAARNRLLAISEGEWIQYLDADDYLLPHKILDQVVELSKLPETDVLLSPWTTRLQRDGGDELRLNPIPEHTDPWILLIKWLLPQTGAPLWRKSALQDVGGWNEKQKVCQDDELYLRLLAGGKKFGYCDVAGAVYRHWNEDTVCRRDKGETYRQRLRIVELAAAHLRDNGELSGIRLDAVNDSRLVSARILWQWDRQAAKSAIQRVNASGRPLQPEAGLVPPFTWSYSEFLDSQRLNASPRSRAFFAVLT